MKYYIKQKVFSLRDTFSVMDSNGNDLYKVKGKMMSISNQMELLDNNEEVILKANKKILTFLPRFFVYDTNNELLATVQRTFGLRPNFLVSVGHQEYKVRGSIFAHSFEIMDGNKQVASISKKVISFGDSYEIEIDGVENELLYLFIVIILDQVIHEKKH